MQNIKGKESLYLEIYPTPSTIDAGKYRLNGKTQASKCLSSMAKRGELDPKKLSLNPDWVEKLMGLPKGYTTFDWDGKPFIGSWKDDSWEKDAPRITKKIKFREERIRMLGNGVVPQTAAIAWQILNDELSNSI